ncbi:MAG: alpha-ketoglutarate-dependent dioxygenase AlkB [Hyphomonadaceae bacterium]|nr:MAG: alkylated DNA repair protein [Caulobacteraceae bacterium]MBT9444492.1 alpha-ketoglutarate-dependent dioxygenase AlkB [Hyphomonadaceae bacterium]TPW03686.1 MAG: alkylated DNA repair protein [Alphaproteobacteria bacterium]
MIADDGLAFLPGRFDRADQEALVAEVLAAVESAPFYTPRLPRTGAAMSVTQTNLGPLGWVADQAKGYRYEPHHPQTGRHWPPIPQLLLDLWRDVAGYPAAPEACLVNLYRDGARMGLHVDADEIAQDAPVVSVSLGDTALFRIGGPKRGDPTRSLRLSSGDVVVLGGVARHCFHGVDRVMAGTSRRVPGGGRINLTLRRVTAPHDVACDRTA